MSFGRGPEMGRIDYESETKINRDVFAKTETADHEEKIIAGEEYNIKGDGVYLDGLLDNERGKNPKVYSSIFAETRSGNIYQFQALPEKKFKKPEIGIYNANASRKEGKPVGCILSQEKYQGTELTVGKKFHYGASETTEITRITAFRQGEIVPGWSIGTRKDPDIITNAKNTTDIINRFKKTSGL
jgi:hypothetical protein